jgi:hypothetical protein
MIEPSDVLYDELARVSASQTSPSAEQTASGAPTYRVIVDSNLGDSTSCENCQANGYLDRRCTTVSAMLTVCSQITSGQPYFGYVSCLASESNSRNEDEIPAGAMKGKSVLQLDAFYEKATKLSTYSDHGCNLVDLVTDMAEAAGDRAYQNDVFLLVSDLAMKTVGESNQIADALTKYVLADEDLTIGLIGVQADYIAWFGTCR